MAADYDYVYYDQAAVVKPKDGAEAFGSLKHALFTRTWEHYTSHQHTPVGNALDALSLCAAPMFSTSQRRSLRATSVMTTGPIAPAAMATFRAFLPAPVRGHGPGWVECTLHRQPAVADHGARTIVHVTAYHPRRTLQPIQHVDQSALTSGLRLHVQIRRRTARAYLAPDGEPVAFSVGAEYVEIVLPPIGAHTVVVLE